MNVCVCAPHLIKSNVWDGVCLYFLYYVYNYFPPAPFSVGSTLLPAAILRALTSLNISLLLMTMILGPTRRSTRFAIDCTAGRRRFPLMSMNTTSMPPSRLASLDSISGSRKTSQQRNSNDGYCSFDFITLFLLLSIPTTFRARKEISEVVTPKSLPISTQKSEERTHAFAIRR